MYTYRQCPHLSPALATSGSDNAANNNCINNNCIAQASAVAASVHARTEEGWEGCESRGGLGGARMEIHIGRQTNAGDASDASDAGDAASAGGGENGG